MAINKKDNGKWSVDVKTAGRRRLRMTCATQKEAAEAERIYLGGGTPTVALEKAERVTLRTLYDMCIKSQHCDWFEHTTQNKCRQAELAAMLLRYFGEDRVADSIKDADVTEMLDHFANSGKGNSKVTLNKKLSALSMMYKIGKRHNLVSSMPDCTHLKIKKAERNQRLRILKREDEPQFLREAWRWCGQEWCDYFLCLIDTGCRTGELGYAQSHHIDWSTGSFEIYPEGARKVKAGARVIRLTERAQEAMRRRLAYNTADSYIFPSFTQNTLNKTIWPRLREALNTFDHDFIPHMLRHTCATRLVEAGANIVAVQKWMGHESLQTTLRYVHMGASGLDEAVDLLNKGTRHATRHDVADCGTGITQSFNINNLRAI